MANPEHVRMAMGGRDVVAQWRSQHSVEKLDLSGANLSGADLTGANLILANLSGADLSWANLSGDDLFGADLSGANLSGADLLEANLTVANLFGANLTGANLAGANLFGANLTGANLTEANLSGATCGFTTFANCDLSQCRGLESVVHWAPSSIGIDTIIKSGGNIPPAFLLGAGVPKEILDALLPLVSSGRRYYKCVISYTSADEEFATRLHRDLEAKSVPCWKYDEDAVAGRKVWADIERAIQENEKMVTICSRSSLERDGVPKEIERALQKEAALRAENVRRKGEAKVQGMKPDLLDEDVLVPVRLDGFVLHEWQHERKADVRATNILDFSGWQNEARYQDALKRLLHALDPATWGPA